MELSETSTLVERHEALISKFAQLEAIITDLMKALEHIASSSYASPVTVRNYARKAIRRAEKGLSE